MLLEMRQHGEGSYHFMMQRVSSAQAVAQETPSMASSATHSTAPATSARFFVDLGVAGAAMTMAARVRVRRVWNCILEVVFGMVV